MDYRKWAMYMEALSVQKNLWDSKRDRVLRQFGRCVRSYQEEQFAYLDFVLTLGDNEPGLLETKDV
ncbi:hypothetical protein POJ06DRAFT_261739 [Lipomyces tetrasporus]|uniref:Uncharacterized protein n=1 Tax=Lipomyces tetrasporus TaxID=54092 RepID=A0AAD7QLJ8_9ASCO|nr:uncharacterized protein POJ06DRAFT_261739 [Lipomyces tetrasporus]KAJ8097565.1 hypothetical protein POJ06DRAFT_261739 [Lipomyces tetrasporus]